jgi:hypothetical protein
MAVVTGRLQMAILVALHRGSNYEKPSPLGMSFSELCQHCFTLYRSCKWATHKTAVSRAVWSLAERECPLVKVWAQLLVCVYSRNQPRDVNAQWLAENSDYGTWFGGSKPRIKLVALTAHGAEEAVCWEPWEQFDFWRDYSGPGSFGTGSRTPPGEFKNKRKRRGKK